MSSTQLWRFLAIAFVPAAAGQLIVAAVGMDGIARLGLLLVMWMPGIAAFVASSPSRRRAVASLKTSGLKWLLPALLLGWSFTLAQSVLLEAGSWSVWNSALFPVRAGRIGSSDVHLLLGTDPQPIGFFAVNWTVTLLLGSVLSALPALGEELGWRAVLQPELDKRMTPFAATVWVGLLWGLWHVPINLGGLNDSAHPVLNAVLVFPAISVLLAFPFAWLWRKTGSVWPVAVCHGAGDAILGGPLVTPLSSTADTLSLVAVTAAIALPFIVSSRRAVPRIAIEYLPR